MTAPPEPFDHQALSMALLAQPALPLRRIRHELDENALLAMERQLSLAWRDLCESGRELPLVSVILPTRNRATTLEAAIGSVLDQDYPKIEVLVIDDGSTDGTARLPILRDRRIRLIRLAGQGVAAARNAGLDAANGTVLAYIDSDNRWRPGHLRHLVTALELTGASIAYDILAIHSEDGHPMRYRAEAFERAECLRGNYVDINVLAHRWDKAVSALRFDPDLRRGVDWDFVLRLVRGTGVAFVPLPGCDYEDGTRDRTRISLAEPRVFLSIVRQKALSGLTVAEIVRRRSFRIFLPASPGTDRLAEALGVLGHELLRPDDRGRIPGRIEAAILQDWAALAGVPSDVLAVLVLDDPPGDLDYARIDRFDLILTCSADLAAHLTAVLRRPVSEVSGKADTALADAIVGGLRRTLLQPRRLRRQFPAPLLAGRARRQVGLIAQRGRNWPNASSYLRVICPLTSKRAMTRFRLVELAGAEDPRLAECDIVILQRFALASAPDADRLADRTRSAGGRLVVDSDDHPDAIGAADPRVTALRHAMTRADQVHVASLALADLHADTNARLMVNRLDPRIWRGGLVPPEPGNGPLRIVYAGTPTHDGDFGPVHAALNRLWRLVPGAFRVAVLGALSQIPQEPWVDPAGKPLTQTAYPDFCQRMLRVGPFHLGLAPLDRNPRNDMKSDLRCLDNAALGAATLASDAPAYAAAIASGLVFGTAHDEDGWFDALSRCLADRGSVHQRAMAMRRTLWSERSVEASGGLDDVLEELCDNGAQP